MVKKQRLVLSKFFARTELLHLFKFYSLPRSLFTTGSTTLGEIFNPVQSCSDIVDEVPEAEDGFYWIVLPKDPKKTKRKVGF